MQAKLAALGGASSSGDSYQPCPSTGNPEKSKKPAASKSKAAPPVGREIPESKAAKDARLRRMCERKPSGRLQVPEEVHNRWKTGSREERDEMIDQLDAVEWQKDIHTYFGLTRVFTNILPIFLGGILYVIFGAIFEPVALGRTNSFPASCGPSQRRTSCLRGRNEDGTQKMLWLEPFNGASFSLEN